MTFQLFLSRRGHDALTSPQTVTFYTFLADFNNTARPGDEDGVLDLDSGVFTCFTPGYYTVSFSASVYVGPNSGNHAKLFLYKNGSQIPESNCGFWTSTGAINADVAVTVSRNLVSNPLEMFWSVNPFARFSTWMKETPWR